MKAKVKATKVRNSRAHAKKVETSSGNVFADLGFEDAEERLLKAKLAPKIAQLIEKKGWTQVQTAERTALDQGIAPPAWPAFRLFSGSFVRCSESLGSQC